MFAYLLTAASSVNAVWTPTPDWVSSWKQKLPLQTIMRMLQVLVPQVEKICIDKGDHVFFLSFFSFILSCSLSFFLIVCLYMSLAFFLSRLISLYLPCFYHICVVTLFPLRLHHDFPPLFRSDRWKRDSQVPATRDVGRSVARASSHFDTQVSAKFWNDDVVSNLHVGRHLFA